MSHQTLFKKLMLGFVFVAGSAVLSLACGDGQCGCGMQAADTSKSQMIEQAFLSACHTPPDPASRSYYLDLLENGTKTLDDVRASITLSCTARQTMNLCQHVSGLTDLCKTN